MKQLSLNLKGDLKVNLNGFDITSLPLPEKTSKKNCVKGTYRYNHRVYILRRVREIHGLRTNARAKTVYVPFKMAEQISDCRYINELISVYGFNIQTTIQ